MTNTDLRQLIDLAKQHAAVRDTEEILIPFSNGLKMPVKRSRPRYEVEKDPIDPSNVLVVEPGTAYLPALVARLIEIRAEKRALSAEEDAIKDVLLANVGELEYIALDEGEDPIVSLRHVQSNRVDTAWVKENFPPEQTPDAWKPTTSRPLRVLGA